MNKALLFKILRWATVVLALVFLVNLCYDGKEKTSKASFEDLRQAVSAQADPTLLQLSEADRLERFYGLKAEEFANCMLYLPTDAVVYVEEILLLELAEPAQLDAVLAAIDARLQTQKNTFEKYNLYGQYEKLCDKTHVEVRGNFVLFVINADAAWQAFTDAV